MPFKTLYNNKLFTIGLAALATVFLFFGFVTPTYADSTYTADSYALLLDAISDAPSGAEIYLSGMIEVEGTVVIPGGKALTFLNADGGANGLVPAATMDTNTPLLVIDAGAELTIGSAATPAETLVIDGDARMTTTMIVNHGNVIMRGGRVTNNLLSNENAYGGGLASLPGSSFTLIGGEFSHLNSRRRGGAIYIAEDALFTMDGGLITNNHTEHHGGGIAIYSTTFVINAGVFTNNNADVLGGGLYIDNHLPLTTQKVFISDNYAAERGGGLWLCPQGGAELNPTEGIAVVGNRASLEGNDFYSLPKSPGSMGVVVSLTGKLLGNGSAKWYVDKASARFNPGNPAAWVELPPQTLQNNQPYALHVVASGSDVDNARAVANIIVTGNTAGMNGGGIANNGDLTIGTPIDSVPVTFSKIALGATQELPGAELQILKHTSTGKVEVARWTSGTTPHVVTLETETIYTYAELSAPAGYELAEDIVFQVNIDGDVLIQDAAGNWIPAPDAKIQMVDKLTPGSSSSSGAASSSGGGSSSSVLPPASQSGSSSGSRVPQTGDDARAAFFSFLAGISFFAVILLIFLRRKTSV